MVSRDGHATFVIAFFATLSDETSSSPPSGCARS